MGDSAQEIRNLLGEYCERIDLGEFEAVGALFADGVLADEHGTALAAGEEAVAEFYRRGTRLHDGSPRTKHLVSNTVIEPPDPTTTADVRSSYLVLQAVPGGALQPIITGRYRDRFERVDGRWRFAERRFFVDLVGDLSGHLSFEL